MAATILSYLLIFLMVVIIAIWVKEINTEMQLATEEKKKNFFKIITCCLLVGKTETFKNTDGTTKTVSHCITFKEPVISGKDKYTSVYYDPGQIVNDETTQPEDMLLSGLVFVKEKEIYPADKDMKKPRLTRDEIEKLVELSLSRTSSGNIKS